MIRTLMLAAAVSVAAVAAAMAEPTYWLPKVQRSDTEVVYTFDVAVPDAMVPWITRRTPIGGGEEVVREIDGRPRTLIRQYVGWDSNGHGPAQGKLAVSSIPGGVAMADWNQDPSIAQDAAVVQALDALAKPSDTSWRYADLLVLRQDDGATPGLRLVEPIPEGDQIKARMRGIAEATVPGQFFPGEVQRPADLDAMRSEMLAWGNLMRRDPQTFRAKNTWANDFGGDTVSGVKGPETLHKVRPQAPFFDDLVLHPQLNEACQWMAEYYAKTNGNAAQPPGGPKHDAPGATYQGASMHKLGDRLDHFAPGVGSSGEGLGGGGPADAYPEGWMRSDTHYRPWFNIDYKTVSMGLGAARTDKGWYFCKIGGTELPAGVEAPPVPAAASATPAAPAVPETQPAPATAMTGRGVIDMGGGSGPAPLSEPRVTVPAGAAMERDREYLSPGGHFYAKFQSDGNLVVARASDDAFFWGLNEQPGAEFWRAARAEMRYDVRLVVSDANGAEIWSAPPAGTPGIVPNSHLEVSDDAILSVQPSEVSRAPSWATQGRGTLPVRPGEAIPPETHFYSDNGDFLLRFSGRDGNVVVARTAGLGFVWGLNLVPGVDFRSAKALGMRGDGRLTAAAADGRVLWAVPGEGAVPGSTATLTDEGVLQVVGPDGAPLWQSR